MKTLEQVTAANPYPAWAKPIAHDGPDGLNVAALRARTADASAVAPVTAYLRRPDGTRERLAVVGVESGATEFAVVVELPADFVGG